MSLKLSRMLQQGVLQGALLLLVGGCFQPQPDHQSRAVNAPTAISATAPEYRPVSFETLAAFPLKVDWLINPTNSSLDSLRRTGEIPDSIKAWHRKKVTLQGYIKPLHQTGGGATEFLLMRNHALCCQTNVPQINEWVHVRMKGQSLPFAHERQFTVRGELQVGEQLGAGNVVSIYQIIGEEIEAASAGR